MNSAEPSKKKSDLWAWILGFVLATSLAVITTKIAHYWRLRVPKSSLGLHSSRSSSFRMPQGLTEAEARARRRPATGDEQRKQAQKVRRDIWRSSTISFFNLTLLGLAVVQVLLDDPLSAVGSIIVLILSIILTAGQQLYATNQVEKLIDVAQPSATIIREGLIRSVPLDEIVIGDVLVVGPGDQFVANGQILSDQAVHVAGMQDRTGESETTLGNGDVVKTGMYCLEGRAAYLADEIPDWSKSQVWSPVSPTKEELTPLQKIMARLLRVLLALIALFLALLVIDMAQLPVLPDEFVTIYRDTASVIFSIGPSGLFFMIVVTYALGSAKIGDRGALVRESTAVESLAQVSTLCFSKTGILTGAEVHLDAAAPINGRADLSETRMRQVLGDIAHSMKDDSFLVQSLAHTFEGNLRRVTESAAYLSALGWSAITVQEADIRGTYVIGEPAALAGNLAEVKKTTASEAKTDQPSAVQRQLDKLRLLVKESQDDSESDNSYNPSLDAAQITDDKEGGSSFFKSLRNQIGELFTSSKLSSEESESTKQADSIRLLFAYQPESSALYDELGRPKLPANLIPISYLRFEEKVRPEAKESIASFIESGVSITILSAAEPEEVAAAAIALDLIDDAKDQESAISEVELPQYKMDQPDQNELKVDIFAQLSPEQKGAIVRKLRLDGERVAMVGDTIADMQAMEQANISITLQSSSQANLGAADIILLKDSLRVLPDTLKAGQRIVNGLLDILKINVTQVSYVLLLLVAMFIEGRRIFYYHPTQGGVIAFFTVIAPSLGLTIWASSGTLPKQYMRSRLWHFIVPAAATLTIAVLALSQIIFNLTQDVEETEQAVTYGLVLMGLILVVFVQPPTRFFVGGDVFSGDWINTYMAIGLFLFYNVLVWIPLAQNLLRLAPLSEHWEYAVIGGVALVWMLVLRAVWRWRRLNRYVGTLSSPLVDES